MVTLHAKLHYSSEKTSFASKKMILKIKEWKFRYNITSTQESAYDDTELTA